MRTHLLVLLVLFGLFGCESADAAPVEPPATSAFVLRGLSLPGGTAADLEVRDGRIVAVGVIAPRPGLEEVDAEGLFVAPAFIDSHVHLVYYPVAGELAAGGVAAAVDQAAPISFLSERPSALRVLAAGPMITAEDGYPTQGWGAGGYGREVGSEAEAVAAVDALIDAGADLIKMPIQSPNLLPAGWMRAIVDRAHARDRKVSSHALTDSAALAAAAAGADLLAHTPVESLSPGSLAAWSERAVVSTLSAFGGSDDAVNNLTLLRKAGATVLYGTDLGNTRTAAIDPREIALMVAAGMDGPAILAAGTSTPAEYWGLAADLGAVEVGRAASLLLLAADPSLEPLTLASPVTVLIDGVVQGAPAR